MERPAYYTVSVEYQEQSATSEEILLEDGERHDKLVLTLDDKPPLKPDRAVARAPDRERFEAAWNRERQGMWAVNPETGMPTKGFIAKAVKRRTPALLNKGHISLLSTIQQNRNGSLKSLDGKTIGLTDRRFNSGEPTLG